MTRGFVTIATGKERYFILARNLLRSYRLHTNNAMPFAVISDSINEYTNEFDKVVHIENPTRTYMDKLRLYDLLPFDETIFIDADSLAFSDLNAWWAIFSEGPDFSGFGMCWNVGSGRGWFDPNNIGEYSGKVSFIPALQGGVYYLRRSQTCKDVFDLAKHLAEHYYEYGFTGFVDHVADEPVLALSMAVHNCRSFMNMPREGYSHVCNMPRTRDLTTDILKPLLQYKYNGKTFYGEMIHWGNNRTRYSAYRFEAEKLNLNYESKSSGVVYFLLYHVKIKFFFLRLLDFKYIPERLSIRLKGVTKRMKST